MADNRHTVGVNLAFSADTGQALQQLKTLEKSLQNIAKMPGTQTNQTTLAAGIKEASQAALELQKHLNNAFNVNTGKLDLSRFSASLKVAGQDINGLSANLLAAGDSGRAAFLQLSKSIQDAEKPMIGLSRGLEKLKTTFANTIRWQISTATLNAVTGTISDAYKYAQNLDAALNDIRIVTGQSSDQMADFAKRANDAAKALSTTTTAYANASLIYFQQGLNDEEVQKRADATIKMANVTGDSAAEVSSYMTAIWNNFDDGSQSLEHYGDVMTALGAATAASSAEIAEGLEKFAAIGDTVGLSYEYATTALATVVAQTRQSADVVGTAFRTLFARIQDLEVGKTLEDGTTLGKYAQALQTIGVNIKTSTGEVKDMNSILDEMGAKWNTISKDTQIAVAQAVAGQLKLVA